jgi:hypothetical protein
VGHVQSPPLWIPPKEANHPLMSPSSLLLFRVQAIKYGNAFGGGTVIAAAFLHILPEGLGKWYLLSLAAICCTASVWSIKSFWCARLAAIDSTVARA